MFRRYWRLIYDNLKGEKVGNDMGDPKLKEIRRFKMRREDRRRQRRNSTRFQTSSFDYMFCFCF